MLWKLVLWNVSVEEYWDIGEAMCSSKAQFSSTVGNNGPLHVVPPEKVVAVIVSEE